MITASIKPTPSLIKLRSLESIPASIISSGSSINGTFATKSMIMLISFLPLPPESTLQKSALSSKLYRFPRFLDKLKSTLSSLSNIQFSLRYQKQLLSFSIYFTKYISFQQPQNLRNRRIPIPLLPYRIKLCLLWDIFQFDKSNFKVITLF